MKILFERRPCRQRETVLSSPFYPLTATWRAKKRHGFSKNLSTKLPKPAPLKKRHLFFAFLLRWSAVADSGVIFSALSSTPLPHGFEAKSKHRAEKFPSTPVPQHPKPKSKHRIEIFFEKPSIPVPQHRAENFQHQLQKSCECPSLSYRNIGGQKTTSIFEISQIIQKLIGFHGSKRKKSVCLFSEADALLVIFSFTSSAGSAARSRPLWACRWTAACSERTAWPLSATGARRRRAPGPGPFSFART